MKGEQGFSLVEMLIALALTGVITGVLAMVVQQTITVPERGNDQTAALHSLQNAIHWFGLDGQTEAAATGGNGLTLTLPDSSNIEYVLYGRDLNRLAGSSNRTIARDVTDASFTVSGRNITLALAAAPAGRSGVSENITSQVSMRVSP